MEASQKRYLPYMIFFRGKLTVNPNTLNNQIHTYFFAHHWQQQHTIQLANKKKQLSFKKFPHLDQKKRKISLQKNNLQAEEAELEKNALNIQEKELNQKRSQLSKKKEEIRKREEKLKQQQQQKSYTYEKWMKLITDVADFNRFYVQCYSKAFTPINIMDFRAFRLFHDWDVWGDSTSFLQIKATASFDPDKAKPIQPISTIESKKKLYLTTKMGTNKCIMANQDTDSQGMSKLFAVTLNMNEQLKFVVDPFVMRPTHFRTVDALPWTSSMGCLWCANGKLSLTHQGVHPCEIDPNLQKLLPTKEAKQGWAQMRFLQYRYNHPQKTSSVIGYIMKTENNKEGKLSYPNQYWSIVSCKSKQYNNPSPDKSYNNNTNNKTTIEIFLKNVTFNLKGKKIGYGILIDLSAAVMDANNQDLFPLLPHYFHLQVYDRKQIMINIHLNLQEVKKLFHINAGMLLVENKQLTESSKISIFLHQKVTSQQQGEGTQVNIQFEGKEEQFNLEIKDKFLKTKEIPLLKKLNFPHQTNQKYPSYKIFQKHITFELYVTNRGQPFSGIKKVDLLPPYDKTNYCNIDSSGLTQYTTNMDYLRTVIKEPLIAKTPYERINNLIDKSEIFRSRYQSIDQIDRQVFQNKLKSIINLTDGYVQKLFFNEKLRYTFEKDGETRQFKLSFEEGKQIFSKQVEFVQGYASVNVYLNQNLAWHNNPRNPALESLCLVGKFSLGTNIQQTFTTIFFQDPYKNPYQDVDWLHTIGPKLKLMGLMYPSMQKIIDLYNYDGLSMNAMKRAFEIEDQNNSRYMPATREMSSVTHRQIRRWLYNPVYDSYIYTTKQSDLRKNELPFKNFTQGKKQLIGLLKQAFKIELTTIPLYLGALYSIKKEGQASKFIRGVAKDQMKHLFIVSNLLNAINESPPYPEPNDTTSPFIPQFPLQTLDKEKGIICFHFQCKQQNKKWIKLMGSLPIQSSIKQQLLRFIMIEMPAQAYLIKIQPLLFLKNKIHKITTDLSIAQFQLDEDYIRKLIETNKRIIELNEAIQAVVLEEQAKRKKQAPQQDEFLTIGMAYNKIQDYLWALNDMDSEQLFNGNKSKQFTYMYLKDMVQIINLRTAMEQIRQIVEEGEGSSIFDAIGEINTQSHFIKFIEIFTGCDLTIQSYFQTEHGDIQENRLVRKGKFIFTPNYQKFNGFPNYNDTIIWDPQTDKKVDQKVNKELQYERLSDNLKKTLFPNTFAPLSFVNSYMKILQELGFIFKADPTKFNRKHFEEVRLKSMQNTIAKMRQMSLNATHIVNPNNTFDNKSQEYQSSSPKFNLNQSSYLPNPIDP